MIIDLPPQTAQMVHSIATQQGQSVEQFILSIVDEKLSQIDKVPEDLELLAEQHGLNSDGVTIVLTEQDTKIIQEMLDNPQTPALKEILALGVSYGF